MVGESVRVRVRMCCVLFILETKYLEETCPSSSQHHCSLLLLHVLVDPKANLKLSQSNLLTKIPSSSSKTASLKMDSPPQQIHEAKHLGLQLPDQESSTIQFTGQSHHEVGAVGGTNSQGQCISSESDQDEGCGNAKGQMKAGFLLNNSDFMFNPSQVARSYSMARVPYPYAEPCVGGLLTAYGPQAIMMGMAPARVPLPLDFTDYGPIYVNPKQYHGILRRRQSRAKLEAQNKLVKARKPYLHESRHRHALNRTRGTGGRFLSTKKGQNPDPTATSSNHYVSDTENISDFDSSQFGTRQHVEMVTMPISSRVTGSQACLPTWVEPCNAMGALCPVAPNTVLQSSGEDTLCFSRPVRILGSTRLPFHWSGNSSLALSLNFLYAIIVCLISNCVRDATMY
nr:nuclear transcription factor y subunit a-3 [Quercus suber]